MAIRPLQPEEERLVTIEPEIEPTKTYEIDFENGRIRGLIDGERALRQFVRKAIMTPRYRYLIYNADYGCEIDELIGADVTDEYLQTEIPRLIREALIYDERIENVDQFEITREKDSVYVSFRVTTTDGLVFDEEVTVVG